MGELVQGGGVEDVPPVLKDAFIGKSRERERETRTYLYSVEPTTRHDDEQHRGKSDSPFEEKGDWTF